MKRRLPLVLLSVAALVILPATTSTATGGGHHGASTPGYSSGYGPGYDKPRPGKPKPTPSAPAGELCGGKRADEIIAWDAYTCDKATGYFLYEKLDKRRSAGYWNSGPQHRVALHHTWAWPTGDAEARKEASSTLPRDADTI